MNRRKKSMKKKILAWMLAAGMAVSGCSENGFVANAAAESSTVENNSGTFGENSEFKYNITDEKLTITGSGNMPDFGENDAPWKDKLNSISTIEIGAEITSIGANTFVAAESETTETADSGDSVVNGVETVILPETLTEIKSKAFVNLKNLKTVKGMKTKTVNGQETSIKIPKDAFFNCREYSWEEIAHTYSNQTPEYSWSEDKTTCTASIKCKFCDEKETEESTDISSKVVKEATCTSEGQKTYTAKFNNDKFSEQSENVTLEKTKHTLNKIEKVEATETKEGNIEYYKCSVCGKMFSDENASKELQESDIIIPIVPAVIQKVPDIGTVTCEGTVSPATTYDKVTLTRTNTDVDGTLSLKPIDFNKSGNIQCDYVFTPADQKAYSEVTGKVTVNVEKDTLESLTTNGTPNKGTYKYGEKFEIKGMNVIANFESGGSKDVTDYVKTSELKVGTTSVDISYTFDNVTKKETFNGFKVLSGDIPDGAPKDTEVANKIKTVSAAASTVLGTGSKWQFASADLSKTIPAGGSLDLTVTYKGSDAAYYTTTTATVKISRAACVEDTTKKLYTGTGEKAPTCTTAGIGHTVCSECGDTMKTNIPVAALGHKIEAVQAKASTCTEKGNDAYYKCSNCGKIYADSAGKTETTIKTYDALGHKYDGQTPSYSWSSNKKTCVATIKCKVCNAQETETAESVCTTLQEPNCQGEGEALYMADFKNKAFSVQFEYGKLPKTTHYLKKVARVEATEMDNGNIEYYECTICKKKFYDSTGKVEITDESDIIIPAKGVEPTSKPTETKTPSENNDPSESAKPSESASPTAKPKGTNIRDTSGVVYKVVNPDSKTATVEYKTPAAVVGGNVKIKDTVKVLGVTYKITSIAANSFKNNKKVTSITLGKNITSIGNSAFQNCTKLKSVTLGNNVKKIGKNAFSNCNKLKTITIKSAKLNSADMKKGAFSGINKKVIIKVPKDCYSVYKALLRSKGLNKKVKFKKI